MAGLLLGIDTGGTYTDGAENYRIRAKAIGNPKLG